MPEQIQAQKTAQLQNQVTTAQLQGLQAAQASQQRASQALQGIPRNPDGTFDIGQLDDALAKANVLPEDHERLLTSFGKVNDTIKSWRQAQLDHTASIADSILLAHGPNDPVTWGAVNQGLAQAKVMGLATDAEAQQFAQLQASGADPVQVLKTIRSQGSKFSGPPKMEFAPAGSTPYINGVAQPTVPGGQKTVAELAADAATLGTDHETKTAQDSANALKAVQGAKAPTAEMDAQKAIGIRARMNAGSPISDDDKNWLKAYDQNREDPAMQAAARAADRQASATAATNARLDRTENFEEAKTGRGELDKAEDTLNKAQAQAQTFRDVVAAAKAGNKYAASQQALEGALDTIRSAGISRINQTEIGASQGAGSLWDNIQGWVGKKASGQPIPADIQDDMLKYADVLEKAAYQQYSDKFDSVTKRYPLPGEKKLPSAGGATTAQTRTATINGKKVTFTKGPKGWTAPGINGVYDDNGHLIKGGL